MQGGDLGTFQNCAAVVFRCVEFCFIVSWVLWRFNIWYIYYTTLSHANINNIKSCCRSKQIKQIIWWFSRKIVGEGDSAACKGTSEMHKDPQSSTQIHTRRSKQIHTCQQIWSSCSKSMKIFNLYHFHLLTGLWWKMFLSMLSLSLFLNTSLIAFNVFDSCLS